jgi:hypothetical protein
MKRKLLAGFFALGFATLVKSQCAISTAVTNDCSYGDQIEAFTLDGISAVGNSGCGSAGYNYFSSPVWTLSPTSYTFSSITGQTAGYNEGFAIWIDLDGDNMFASSEMLWSSAAAQTHSGSINLAGATGGTKRMRIMCAYNLTMVGSDACSSSLGGYGEIEDYDVVVSVTCPSVAPTLSIAATSTNVCSGTNVTLTASGSTGTYTWAPGSLTGSAVVVSPGTTTNYSLTSSIPGCTIVPVPATKNISVTPTPTISVASSNTTFICPGGSVSFTATGASSYSWNTGATTSTLAVSPSVTTTYTVSSGGSCPGTAVKTVSVNTSFAVSLSAAQNTACTNGSTISLSGTPAGGTYTGTNVSGAVFTPANAGTFTPVYTYSNAAANCAGTATTSIVVSVCTGLNNAGSVLKGLSVYPNPTNGIVNIELNNGLNKNVTVTDINGKIVYSTNSASDKMNVNLSGYSQGFYFVKIDSDGKTEIIKVLKQ